jgi:ketosteroid isomerase-like protein
VHTTTEECPTVTIESGSATDTTAIRTVLDQRVAAHRAKDAKRFVSHYAADVVSFELAPPLAESGSAVLDTDGWDGWYGTWLEGPGIQITQLSIAAEGNLAYCHSLNRLRGIKTDGTTVDLWFRATLVLRRTDGIWKVVHEHNSTPFYMDGSDRAALDLQP